METHMICTARTMRGRSEPDAVAARDAEELDKLVMAPAKLVSLAAEQRGRRGSIQHASF